MVLLHPQGPSRVDDVPGVDERVIARSPCAPRRFVLKLCTIVADIVVIGLAMTVAFRLKVLMPGKDPSSTGGRHLFLALMSVPLWMGVFWHYRLYSARYLTSKLDEFRRLVHAALVVTGLLAIAGFMLQVYVARGWLLLTAVLSVVFLVVERSLVRLAFAAARSRGKMMRRIVIVGGNVEGLAICSMLDSEPTLGYQVAGFVDDESDVGTCLLADRPVLGSLADAVTVVGTVGATGVVMATTAIDNESSNRLTRRLTEAGVHVELSSSLRDISPSRLFLRPLGRFPTIYVEPVRRHGWRARAKRIFDMAVAALTALIVAPLLLAAAVAIKLTSRGPVLFRQQRVGKGGELFELLKLRTMVTGAEFLGADLRDCNEADGPLFKIRRDPRCTRVGRTLRALSLDELPQLWNVIKGDMSLVGPRPALPGEVGLWSPELHQRLEVKPGMTGMWQVSGRSNASFEEYTRLDLYYVDNWSLWTDLAILAKTVPTVLLRAGAC